MRRIPFCFLAALLLTGCRERAPAPSATKTPPPTADSVHHDTTVTVVDVPTRLYQLLPDSLRIHPGCPFECCTYREWKARAAITAYARERDTGSPSFVIPAGERFDALGGNIHMLQTAVVVAGKQSTYTDGKDEQQTIEPGDTLLVLNPIGEGYYDVWRVRDGRKLTIEGEWEMDRKSKSQVIGTSKWEWWVHVRRRNGQEGWFNANVSKFGNADRCGLPEE